MKADAKKSALTISKLNKSYIFTSKAVDNMSFALDYGECFALLGVTGGTEAIDMDMISPYTIKDPE